MPRNLDHTRLKGSLMTRPFLLVLVFLLWPMSGFSQCENLYLANWRDVPGSPFAGCPGVPPPFYKTIPTSPASSAPANPSPTRSPMSTPVLGLVAGDVAGEVLVIQGTPSSAILLPPAYAPVSFNRVFVPPHQSFVLAETATPQALGISILQGETLSVPASISEMMTAPDLVSFSPGGTAALLYQASSSRLQVITGLPTAPAIGRDVEVTGVTSAAVQFALSDDATLALCLTSDGLLYQISAQGGASLLYSGAGAGSIAFLPQSSSALFWDGAAQSLVQINGISSGLSISVLAANVNLGGDARLEVSAGASQAILADSSSANVISIDLSTREVTEIPISHSAAALKSLRIPNLFLLSAETGKSAWILYLDSSGARSYGVPRTVARRRLVPLSAAAGQTTAAPGKSVAPLHEVREVSPPDARRRQIIPIEEREQ